MTMALLNASLRTELRNVLVALPHPVTLIVFVGGTCETCGETRELVEELASISEGTVRLEVHDLDANPPEATLYRVDKTPASGVGSGLVELRTMEACRAPRSRPNTPDSSRQRPRAIVARWKHSS
jgi:hypothetical protein